ncbi:MAG: PfkB family carbohydrate kinase [Actinomycetota bacterium]|nr:PfkB family carbohydrate kinase [Actinomycetota bacterium]
MSRIVVVGDVLLDVDVAGSVRRLSPEAPVPVVEDPTEHVRPGGAGLAAVLATAAADVDVALVTALCDDPAARLLRGLLGAAGVELLDLGTTDRTAEKVRIRNGGHHIARLDRGVASSRSSGDLDGSRSKALAPQAILVADYGRGVTENPSVRRWLEWMVDERVPVVWDPHVKGGHPVPGVRVATPNRYEARALHDALSDRESAYGHTLAPAGPERGDGIAADTAAARRLMTAWSARSVAVTRGALGALLTEGDGPPLVIQPCRTSQGDTCGAGDSFAIGVAQALAAGALASEAVAWGVEAASRYVAAGGPASVSAPNPGAGGAVRLTETTGTGTGTGTGTEAPPAPGRVQVRSPGRSGSPADFRPNAPGPAFNSLASEPPPPARSLSAATSAAVEQVRAVRRRGGTVVATGGCFDVLHIGHLELLRNARSLGDLLVVLVNSDESVRRLKGAGRPLVNQGERAALLAALDPVDAVVVFDEDDPGAVLAKLEPDLFVKGGDYAGRRIPEADVLAAWGGSVVTVPYVSGRSTSELVRMMSPEVTPEIPASDVR